MNRPPTVTVKVRYSGGTYLARAGRGKAATSASATGLRSQAARRAAAKFFKLDASNVQTADDVVLDPRGEADLYVAILPAREGGAS